MRWELRSTGPEPISAATRSEIRRLGRRRLKECERQCEDTDNPYWAWDGYLVARLCMLPIPDWVLGYLDVSAHLLTRFAVGNETKSQEAGVAWAMGFSSEPGRGNEFSQIRSDWRDHSLAGEVYELVLKDPSRSLTSILAEVAGSAKVSEKTVQRALRKLGPIDTPPGHK